MARTATATIASYTTATNAGASVTTLGIAAPAAAPGDLLIALLFCDNDGSDAGLTAGTSGFTQQATSNNTGPGTANSSGWLKVFRKVVTTSEPSTYTFGTPSGTALTLRMLWITGAEAQNPFASVPSFSHPTIASTASHIAPSISPTRPGLLICSFVEEGCGAGATYTNPASMSGTSFIDGANNFLLTLDASLHVNAGSTGTKTAVASTTGGTSTQGYLTMSMVIADAIIPQQPIVMPPRSPMRSGSW